MTRNSPAMRRLLILAAFMASLIVTPCARATPHREIPRNPLADAAAHFAAYSLGTSVQVAKLAVTVGDKTWFYDARGERLYRCDPATARSGGACKRWAVVRIVALDPWGSDLYGPVWVLLQRHRDLWLGRMLGHVFSDPGLRGLGIDSRTLTCLHAQGL
ncbi:MAG: hypothetical protein EB084_03870 [Proteobacteria bacterium]|nr:hypothetical protein [Pseudomonadota bacterium]